MKGLLQQLKEVRYSFVHTPQAIRFVWRGNHWGIVGLAVLTLAGALLPAAQAWVPVAQVPSSGRPSEHSSSPRYPQTRWCSAGTT